MDPEKIHVIRAELAFLREEIDRLIRIIDDKEIIPYTANRTDIIVNDVLFWIANYYNLSIDSIKSKSRVGYLPTARHVFVTIFYELFPDMTLNKVGSHVGIGHSDVIHGIKKVANSKKKRSNLYYDYLEIKNNILRHIEKNERRKQYIKGK